jgi:integrase
MFASRCRSHIADARGFGRSVELGSQVVVAVGALAKAGIRRIRLHDLRHTFGSLLIQNGASIIYVKDQMGHSSIQVTVDI